MARGENFAHRIVQSGLRLESTILSTTCDFYAWFHFISVPGHQIQLAEMPPVCLCVTLWLVQFWSKQQSKYLFRYRSLALIAAGAGRDGRLPSTPQRPFHHGSWFKFRFRFRFWLWYRRWFRGSRHIWQNTIHTIVHNTAVSHWSPCMKWRNSHRWTGDSQSVSLPPPFTWCSPHIPVYYTVRSILFHYTSHILLHLIPVLLTHTRCI